MVLRNTYVLMCTYGLVREYTRGGAPDHPVNAVLRKVAFEGFDGNMLMF